MKTVCLLLVLSVLALANPISVGPIRLTGSGSYEWGYGVGPVMNFSASASNGTDSASLYVSDWEDKIHAYIPLPFTGGLAPLGPFFEGTGTIDGITVPNFRSRARSQQVHLCRMHARPADGIVAANARARVRTLWRHSGSGGSRQRQDRRNQGAPL
jgi:hypothetical protein